MVHSMAISVHEEDIVKKKFYPPLIGQYLPVVGGKNYLIAGKKGF